MLTLTKELIKSRELALQLAGKNLRARYQQSLLGWAWAILLPTAQAATLTVVFTYFVPVDTDGVPYLLFCYVAMAPWTFFASALTDMANSLVENMSLVTKIYFPRHILPFASMLARLADFGVASVLGVVMLWALEAEVSVGGLLYLPIIVAIQLLLTLGLGLACAALNVFFRDVRSILVLGLQLWLYASPVMYPLQSVPESVSALYQLNPMVGIIESYRDILIRSADPGQYLLTSALLAFAIMAVSLWTFRRLEWRFADVV